MLVIFTLNLWKVKQTSVEFLLFACLVFDEKIFVFSKCGKEYKTNGEGRSDSEEYILAFLKTVFPHVLSSVDADIPQNIIFSDL